MARKNKSDKIPKNPFLVIGTLLILSSFLLAFVTLYPVIKLEVSYNISSIVENSPSTPEKSPLGPPNTDFAIVIPKIEATSIIVADVDPNNSTIYQRALTQGVAHAQGTSYPGQGGNTFLFSHSSVNFYEASRFNSVFYLLNKLETGDEITIYYNGDEIPYSVASKELVDPDAVEYLEDSGKETLTLMTCWPPGTTYKRLIVTAHPK